MPILFGFSDQTKVNYYVFPIQPGQANYLAGTMGELRSTHFHGGLDIKTNQREGLPVYAAAEGYVSRIRIHPRGYGNTLYLTHPNGTVTVYAHLQKFTKEIQQYIHKEMTIEKCYEIDHYVEKQLLPIKRGAIIAYSGNSGSSTGPHLHFEVRDADENVLNPLFLQQFNEIKDHIAPVVTKLAITPQSIWSRVDDQFQRKEWTLNSASSYPLARPIEVYGDIGLELLTFDRQDGTRNRNGTPIIKVFVDGNLEFHQEIDRFSFAESKENIRMFYHYPTQKKYAKRFNKLYIEDGNELSFYPDKSKKGIIKIEDDKLHNIKIELTDAYKNTRNVYLKLQGKPPIKKIYQKPSFTKSQGYELHQNVLLMYQKKSVVGQSDTVWIKEKYRRLGLLPEYQTATHDVYLWDLRTGLPDSILFRQGAVPTHFQFPVKPNYPYSLYHQVMDLAIPKDALYDTLYLQLYANTENGQEVFSIGDPLIPLRKPITISFKPKANMYLVDPNKLVAMYVSYWGKKKYVGGTWHNNRLVVETRELGQYTLEEDILPPTIQAIRILKSGVKFKIRDNLSGIGGFNLYINGKWTLLQYDKKSGIIWTNNDDANIPFAGTVELVVYDNVNNFNRYINTIQK